MNIAQDKVVELDYQLTVRGEVLDHSEPGEPLTYLHGTGQIVPGLEKVMAGRTAGDQFKVDEIIDETLLDLEQIASFLKELEKFKPSQDKKLQALLSLLKNALGLGGPLRGLSLGELTGPGGLGEVVGEQAEALLLLGRARSSLEFLEPGHLLDGLQDRLLDLQDTCRAVNEAVTAQYFHVSPYVSWADARVSDGEEHFIEESEL